MAEGRGGGGGVDYIGSGLHETFSLMHVIILFEHEFNELRKDLCRLVDNLNINNINNINIYLNINNK